MYIPKTEEQIIQAEIDRLEKDIQARKERYELTGSRYTATRISHLSVILRALKEHLTGARLEALRTRSDAMEKALYEAENRVRALRDSGVIPDADARGLVDLLKGARKV